MTQIQALRPGHRTKEQNRRAQAMSLILPGVTREPDRAGAGAALKKTRAIVRGIEEGYWDRERVEQWNDEAGWLLWALEGLEEP